MPPCPKCNKEFRRKAGLDQHLKRKTPCVKAANPIVAAVPKPDTKVLRLNYIGSKYQLLDWIYEQMLAKTGFETLAGKTVADCFAGTGIVSYFLRTKGCKVLANDIELYSAVIGRAFVAEVWTPQVKEALESLNKDLEAKKYENTAYFITKNYSPYEGCERKFFTVDNARRIDYCRAKITNLPSSIQSMLLASLILSADAVANVPAVYGCFLKKFKARAEVPFVMKPIHTNSVPPVAGSHCTMCDVTTMHPVEADIAYLDPPYNERQYSKNYFPLSMIVQHSLKPLKGKTGIPEHCYLSPLCQKRKAAEAFKNALERLKCKWVFLSYNSESLLSKEEMTKILGTFGEVSVIEREYKRFKSFEYNEDKAIQEYLFCLKKTDFA